MGVDIIEGSVYLIKIDTHRIYSRDISEITNKFNDLCNIFYLEDFSAIVIVNNTHGERYNYIKEFKPIGWNFSPYCKKYNCNIIPDRLEEFLKYEFEKEEYEEKSRKFIDYVVDHGWYEIGYISY